MNRKRYFAYLLLLIVGCLFHVSEAEEDSISLTINVSVPGHVYTAYQMFSGGVGEVDGKKLLTDPDWGTGILPSKVKTSLVAFAPASVLRTDEGIALKKNKTGTSCLSETLTVWKSVCNDPSVARLVVKDILTQSGFTYVNAVSEYRQENGNYVISGLNPGYYVIFDEITGTGQGTETPTESLMWDAPQILMLEVTGQETIQPKLSLPVLTNQVQDDEEWVKQCVKGKDDTIRFKLLASMPSDLLQDYTHYSVVIHDSLPKGMVIVPDSVEIYTVLQNGSTLQTRQQVTESNSVIDISPDDDGDDRFLDVQISFSIFEDPNGILGPTTDLGILSHFQVTFEAVFSESMNTGNGGNENQAYMEYLAGPDTTRMGKTATDTATVYTSMLIVRNMNQNEEPLSGSVFLLEKCDLSTNEYVTVGNIEEDTALPGNHSVPGLSRGFYRISESQPPPGYNRVNGYGYFSVQYVESEGQLRALFQPLEETSEFVDTTKAYLPITLTQSGGAASSVYILTLTSFPGIELPTTGGMGTRIFEIVGASLLLVSLFLMLLRRFLKR